MNSVFWINRALCMHEERDGEVQHKALLQEAACVSEALGACEACAVGHQLTLRLRLARLSSVLLPVARKAQDDDPRSEAGSTTSYFTNRWLPAGIGLE